ncbi:MAG: hypothetical protein M1133_15205 [Armatimonadetes bacterium]|nr:hypothetical protein [Armatimonadota bacterium]
MDQLPNYGDGRQSAFCVYCGDVTETRDHVPSRVLLDEPYPDNLPVVSACEPCNSSFSKDEEYVACLVECALRGVVGGEGIQRQKIERILRKKPALAARIEEARSAQGDHISFGVERDRVRTVVLKLARGHAAFELNEPQLDEPRCVAYVPLSTMSDDMRSSFETPPVVGGWPEVGSRAMLRLIGSEVTARWIVVQPSQYRYLVYVDTGVVVRMVIGDYLACEVIWG